MVGLDPRSARLVKIMLQEMAAAGKSVLMSTHSLSVAEQIANRIGIIDKGHLHFYGTIESLRNLLSEQAMTLEDLFLKFTSRDHSLAASSDNPYESPALNPPAN